VQRATPAARAATEAYRARERGVEVVEEARDGKPPAGTGPTAVGGIQVADDVLGLVQLGVGDRVDEIWRLHLAAPRLELGPMAAAARHGVGQVVEIELAQYLADLPAGGARLEVVELEELRRLRPPIGGDGG